MTTNLRSVEALIEEMIIEHFSDKIGYTRNQIRKGVQATLTSDRAHIATGLIAGLEGKKRRHYDEQQPFLKHRNDFNDAYNEVVDDAIALIKATPLPDNPTK